MELTLRDVQKQLDQRGHRMHLSYSGGQYNTYIFEGERLVKCERGDDMPEAVERALAERSTAPGAG